MLLKNKTNRTIPINGTKTRAYRVIEVPDDYKYDKMNFEEVTTDTKVGYNKKVNSTRKKSKEE